MRPLAYKVHPYRWPTIGREIKHIEEARLEDVEAFFYKFYRPNNAIMAVTGHVEYNEVVDLVEKWFGSIPTGERPPQTYAEEPRQTEARELTLTADVPADMLYKAYHVAPRRDPGYYAADVLSDILSRGQSSRLHQRLVKDNPLFSDVGAGLSGEDSGGLMIVSGRLREGVAMATAEAALDAELARIAQEAVGEAELEKIKNQITSTTVFGEMSTLNVAMNLCFSALLGDANLVNTELGIYKAITAADVLATAKEVLRPENCNTIHYLAKPKA
jgi:predicted Zn-dependent peptidase